MKAFSFLVVCLIPAMLSLEFKIVDEDYLEIPIGGEKRAIKLLIDPVGHFTYILRPFISSTKIKHDETFSFDNNFGHFEGHWETDFIFPTPDRQFGFQLRYLLVDKKESNLNVDGVIGLGYSEYLPSDTNIYKILGNMKTIFDFKNVMTYDKAHSRLVIGSVPDPDSFNPVDFDILPIENPKIPVNLVELSKIGFVDKENEVHYFNLTQHAKFGLMPLLIAPKQSEEHLKEMLPFLTTDEPDKIKFEMNSQELYQNIFFTQPNEKIKPQAIMSFGKTGYKFAHTRKDKEDEMLSSSIRLSTMEYGNYWYIGIDKLNINRADFDFDKKKVTMYSPTAYEIGKTKYPYFAICLLSTIAFASVLAIIIRYCCSKKKQSEIKEGEELIYL